MTNLKIHNRVLSFLMCVLLVLTICVLQPLNQPKAALPIVLVPALVAVFSLAAAVGINFAVNAIAGETPTSQNNIAIAIIDRLDEVNNTLHPTNALVKNLINQITEKAPARVTAPDPVTGKSSYSITNEEWIQTRAAWYEYLATPYTNGTLSIDGENAIELEYVHAFNGITGAPYSTADKLARACYELNKGLVIEFDKEYTTNSTWSLSGDEYVDRRKDPFTIMASYDGSTRKFTILSKNLTTGRETTYQITVGVAYPAELYGIDQLRIMAFRNTTDSSITQNGVYFCLNKDTTTTGDTKYSAINALPDQGVTPISYNGEVSGNYWFDLGTVTTGGNSISADLPYKTVPDVTGTNKVEDNWNNSISADPLATEQDFTIDFDDATANTTTNTLSDILKTGVNTSELDISEYDLPEFNRPTLKALFVSKFPFCLPWDLAQAVKLYQAPAEAPNFEVDFLAPIKEEYHIEGDTTIRFNMEDYAIVGEVIRWSMLILFGIGLIILTPKLIKY